MSQAGARARDASWLGRLAGGERLAAAFAELGVGVVLRRALGALRPRRFALRRRLRAGRLHRRRLVLDARLDVALDELAVVDHARVEIELAHHARRARAVLPADVAIVRVRDLAH